MAFSIKFTPNLYDFNSETANEDCALIQKKKTKISNIITQRFLVNGQLDFVRSLKYTETLLGLQMVNTNYSVESLNQYASSMFELNRFEEVYDVCSQLIESPNLSRSAYDAIKSNLILAALFMEEPERISHFMKQPAPEHPQLYWIYYIQYHQLMGTQEELLQKPLPHDTTAKLFLYYVCEEYTKIIALQTSPLESLNIESKWIVWLTLKRCNDTEIANIYLPNLLSCTTSILCNFIEEMVIEELSKETSHQQQISHFFERYRNLRPVKPRLSVLVGKMNPEHRAYHFDQVRKISATFPNLLNKKISIQTLPAEQAQKMEILARTAKAVKPKFNIFCELMAFYTSENNLAQQLDLCAQTEQSGAIGDALKIRIAAARASLAKTESEQIIALEKIEDALRQTPHSKQLLRQKITLLTKLNRKEEAKGVLEIYLKRFEVDSTIAMLGKNIYLSTGEIDKAIDLLKRCYDCAGTIICVNECINIYKEHKTNEELLDFFIKFIFIKETCLPEWFDAAIKAINKLDNPAEGVALISSVKRGQNYSFITRRCGYYLAIGRYEEALVDIKYVHKINPYPYLIVNVSLKCGKFDEVIDFLLKEEKYPEGGDHCEELLGKLEDSEGYEDEIIKLAEKYKPQTFASLKVVAYAYIGKEKYSDALVILNKLKAEKNVEVIHGRALCYIALGRLTTVEDLIEDGLKTSPGDPLLMALKLDVKKEREEKGDPVSNKADPAKENSSPKYDPKRIPQLIEDKKEESEAKKRYRIERRAAKAASRHLQNSSVNGVTTLIKNPELQEIKAIARRGERETAVPAAAPAPILAPRLKVELPKPIVKTHLRDFERVFLNRGLDALKEIMKMNISGLPEKVVFNNYIYTILRVFTPIRLNALEPVLKHHLKTIRDDARHASDLVHKDKLTRLFKYLTDINLEGQIENWVAGKLPITRLMLRDYGIIEKGDRKTPMQRIMEELEFIKLNLGEISTWKDRVYHRNAIKASLSIIGEASNFLENANLKGELASFREEGNKVAHHFFEEGDSFEYTERFKDEEITPEALWELAQKGIELYGRLS